MRSTIESKVATPRTDAAILNAKIPSLHDGDVIVVYAEVARQLERELTALRGEVEAHLRLCKGENNL